MSAHHDSFLTDRSGKATGRHAQAISKIATAPDRQEDELATEEVLLNVSHARNQLCDLDKRPRAAWAGYRFNTAKWLRMRVRNAWETANPRGTISWPTQRE